MQGIRPFLVRVLVTLLFLAVPALGVYTFVIAPDHGWWFMPTVTTYGPKIDALFDVILWMVAITFVLTNAMLVWCIWWFGKPRASKADFSHGNHKLEMVWTAIPAVLLLVIAFSQMKTWNEIKSQGSMQDGPYTPAAPFMEVYASQFDWRARYPDENGNFKGFGAVESAFDIVVPVNTKVVFSLKSRDVLHSFFVPAFRLKQDAVPGLTIPVWFQAEQEGEFDLICAELCGWGHYKMAGRVHVVSQEKYEAWLAGKRAELTANGTEEL